MGRDGKDDNVKVVVRCRPLSDKNEVGHKCAVDINDKSGQIIVNSEKAESRSFTFDNVFGFDVKQVDIYNICARPIVESVLEGYNGTIFAYGQTGTGKTFTMEGVRSEPTLRGIIPNSFTHIFDHITKSLQSNASTQFLVRASYLEIYQEQIRDLLGKDQNKKLVLKESPDTGVYAKDLTKYVVNNSEEMDKLMSIGNKNRATGKTDMNEHSSQSHAIFTITIECSAKGIDKKNHIRAGKLHLVDLAGSERQSKTGAQGVRLKEATKINLSLSTLGNVISALVDKKSKFIPYRNSYLTRLLQDSLGGNSKTLMVANVGPSAYNIDETMNTLRYANRAKNIQNKAIINEDPKDALLRQFQDEIAELKRKLANGGVLEDEDDGQLKRVTKVLSPQEIERQQNAIEMERRRLKVDTKMLQEDREKAESVLKAREKELNKQNSKKEVLEQRLAQIRSKVIVGGEDLVVKHDEQQKLLNEANDELKKREELIEKTKLDIASKTQEAITLEENYNSLREEAEGKTKKLKKIWTMLIAGKGELEDMRANHERDIEEMMESCQDLSKELGLAKLIIDSYIPEDFQKLIQNYVTWNEQIGEYQLKGVAYTGNNMILSQRPIQEPNAMEEAEQLDLSGVYMAYTEDTLQSALAKQPDLIDSEHLRYDRTMQARQKRREKADNLMNSVLNS